MHNTESPQYQKMVEFIRVFSEFTGNIQTSISLELLKNPEMREKVSAQLSGSEEMMQRDIDRAVRAFIGAMPLATAAGGQNLFTSALSYHSDITKDPLVQDLLRAISETPAID